ncbi:MAG: TRAP transporter small permease subunit [Rhodobacteraceae bacterium]|jgi:TRAP-type C4-dicarboxylate transport system permease small subunit|uniref:TRAP transporter small permease protein n=1 Tax=Thioclava marina TaxID=1915077 RepID=A0ABX3MJA9_9RHOB|nr:TRAP transporter small permease subunit [Thioclava marina]OOY11356.1 TRAP transporter small permease protein [Thioclava marina]TNF13790.1 MAG: TRAP transporter small permease subunit [Paracoccaceae bacterium]
MHSPIETFLRKTIYFWALAGGGMLGAIVAVNVWTVLGGFIGLPFAGDFELTEMGVAIAAFMFLPYCQLADQNVTADIFTSKLSAAVQRRFSAIASVLALAFAALLLWRMYLGMLDQKSYSLATTILQIPVWWAYLPALASLALLFIAAGLSLRDNWTGRA